MRHWLTIVLWRLFRIYLVTWPRISPPLLAAVWMLKYHLPAIRSEAWASVSVASPSNGLFAVVSEKTGICTAALLPGSAGPWKWAAVAGPVEKMIIICLLCVVVWGWWLGGREEAWPFFFFLGGPPPWVAFRPALK